MKVIMIAGLKRSGKDTLATSLYDFLRILGKDVKILHFADKLKDEVSGLLGIERDKLEELKNNETHFLGKENSGTYRSLLQNYGELIKQKLGKGYWANEIKKEIELLKGSYDFVIIPDYRFLVEGNVLSELDDIELEFVKIIKPDIENNDKHNSENELSNVAFPNVVYNDSSLLELRDKAHTLVHRFLGDIDF